MAVVQWVVGWFVRVRKSTDAEVLIPHKYKNNVREYPVPAEIEPAH